MPPPPPPPLPPPMPQRLSFWAHHNGNGVEQVLEMRSAGLGMRGQMLYRVLTNHGWYSLLQFVETHRLLFPVSTMVYRGQR